MSILRTYLLIISMNSKEIDTHHMCQRPSASNLPIAQDHNPRAHYHSKPTMGGFEVQGSRFKVCVGGSLVCVSAVHGWCVV